MHIELRHFRYFVAVAEELHFSRAAQRLHISPPSLTQQIKSLEIGLRVRLFDRTKRSVTLTDAGAQFLEQARATLRQAERAELVGRQAGRGEVGRIEIGYVTSASCAGLVSAAIKAYLGKHPLVDIQLTKLETPVQLEALASGQLDIGFLRPPVAYPIGLTGFVVLGHPLIAALPSDHRLANAAHVRVADLREERFIAPTVEIELGFDNHTGRIAARGKFAPKIIRRRPDILTIITLVGAGLGVAIVPDSFQAIRIPGVVYKPIVPREEAKLAAAFRNDERGPAIRAFIQHLREQSAAGHPG
jgi:DNA-binding transcriptional LysR family regulator